MDKIFTVSVDVLYDEDGMIGRKCNKCLREFKLKPWINFDKTLCNCPYCDQLGSFYDFITDAQYKYVRSVAEAEFMNSFINPAFKKIASGLNKAKPSFKRGLFQFKFSFDWKEIEVPIEYYKEEDLETKVTCDSCGLDFSIYGVFAHCPHCVECNAFLIFSKSLDVTNKQFEIISKEGMPNEILEFSLGHMISSCVSAFDALGKELRRRKPQSYPDKPRNLFQNIFLLDEKIGGWIRKEHSDFDFLLEMFQVRHLYEHNMGVIDKDFVEKFPDYNNLIGRKYLLSKDQVLKFISCMRELGDIVKYHFYQQ